MNLFLFYLLNECTILISLAWKGDASCWNSCSFFDDCSIFQLPSHICMILELKRIFYAAVGVVPISRYNQTSTSLHPACPVNSGTLFHIWPPNQRCIWYHVFNIFFIVLPICHLWFQIDAFQ